MLQKNANPSMMLFLLFFIYRSPQKNREKKIRDLVYFFLALFGCVYS
uniref:Uncharacterized protein n=1 Tax=Rhizophora mucronata TaxID=61149 RepID=A0A2P2PCC2_RHIMU